MSETNNSGGMSYTGRLDGKRDKPAPPSREAEIAARLTEALMDAWLRHPATKAGEWGKPDDVYFSVEKAVWDAAYEWPTERKLTPQEIAQAALAKAER